MSRWFRWYEGTSEDGKFRVVARNANVTVAVTLGVWAMLLEDASHADHRGLATRGENFYAAILDLKEEELHTILDEMEGADLIQIQDAVITIRHWKERQFETDQIDSTNADRQRRWRDKQKVNGWQTPRNGTITATKRPDTDTDTDTEKKESVRAVAVATRLSADELFERFWSAYPRRGTAANPKKPARDKFERAVKSGADPETIIAAAKRFAEVERSDGRFGTEKVAQAVTWLNQHRWGDYTEPAPATGPPVPPDPSMPTDAELRARYAQKIPDRTPGSEDVFREGDGAYPADESALHHPIGRA